MTAHLIALEVRDLFQPDRDALVGLLRGLKPNDWSQPTVCAGWDVRDVALHILGGDLGNISRRRDLVEHQSWGPGEAPGAFLARLNEDWVRVGRRLSPRLIIDLLEFNGPALFAYFRTLDASVMGGPVSWAGRGSAPVWLDVAREYMERWVHQQHIRDAVGRPGQTDPQFVNPVIAASMHALPVAMERHAAHEKGAVVIRVLGRAGGTWNVTREDHQWRLLEGTTPSPRTTMELEVEDWWRVVTLGISPETALSRARVTGDAELARAAINAVAIIA